jgi:hypothetical protein
MGISILFGVAVVVLVLMGQPLIALVLGLIGGIFAIRIANAERRRP